MKIETLCVISALLCAAGCSGTRPDTHKPEPTALANPVRSYLYCDEHGIRKGQTKENVLQTLQHLMRKEDRRERRLVAVDADGRENPAQDLKIADQWRFRDILASFSGTIVTLRFQDNVLVDITEGHLR